VSLTIEDRVRATLAELPDGVELVAAAKTRSPSEIRSALAGGVRAVGQNYVQEAEVAIAELGRRAAAWHMIGHLQRNKVKAAVRLFDLIQTVDSERLAEKIASEARKAGRVMPILIEINSASEAQKSGVLSEQAVELVRRIAPLEGIRVDGLMTMGPFSSDPEDLRPAFRRTKALFDRIASLGLPNAEMKTLSMGMSDSYRVAIEEGANMVRIGTALFGPRA
jgi:pyridoxal phosphate enzyme (YggS family)